MMSLNKEESGASIASAQVLQLPVRQKSLAEVDAPQSESPNFPASDLAREYERFQLQVQLDIESERELLYKSVLVVEVIAFVFVLREILIRWLA